MEVLRVNNFKGTNTEDENLSPNVLPFAYNVDSSNGRLSKRLGYTSLVDLGTTGSPKGLHTAKFSTGDTLLVGADTSAYKLDGSGGTKVYTTTADFDTGTTNNTLIDTTGDVLKLTELDTSITKTTTTDFNAGSFTRTKSSSNAVVFDEFYSSTYPHGTQEFANSYSDVQVKFTYDYDVSAGDGCRYRVKLYDSSMNEVVYLYIRVDTWNIFYDPEVNGSQSPTYFGSLGGTDTGTHDVEIKKNGNTVEFYVDGTKVSEDTGVLNDIKYVTATRENYDNGVADLTNLYGFPTYGSKNGYYYSQVVDIGSTPKYTGFSFSISGSITAHYATSDNGTTFTGWTSASGYTEMGAHRYVKFRFYFSSTSTYLGNESLNDFTVYYDLENDNPLDGSYYSETIDIGQTPVNNTLEFTKTEPTDSFVKMYVRGSDDGVRFGDWSLVSASTDSIYLKRYIEVRVDFERDSISTEPYVSDFTVSYINAFDNATSFDTGLTGNKIRWVNYQGQQDDGAGGTELAQYVYYVDGTSYKKYDGTTVTTISGVPASNIIYEHRGYMFFVPSGDESRLYFSDPYGATLTDPLAAFEAVDDTYYIQFPAKIKGLRTFQGKLVVSGDDFTSFVTGNIFGGVEDNTVVYQIDDKGVPNHESMATCSTSDGNILAMVTSDGIMYLTGSEYENALEQRPLTDTVQTYINDGDFTNSYLKYHDGKLYFGFNSGIIPTDYVDSILVFDFKGGLTIDGIWSIALNDMAIFNGRLYGSSSSNTKLFELQSGENDDGSDIEMKAVIRFNFGNVKTTLQRVKIKATTDTNITDLTNADLIVYNDNHSRTIDLTSGRWRESNTHFTQYKGQDLMESKRSIKKRGTFVEATVDVSSSYKFEVDSFEFEYKGVRQ